MSKKQTSTSTRSSILDAANQVVLAEGVKSLTLEAVAREAGVSKGGLLYHFPSKQALIEGMVSQLSDMFVDRLASAFDEDNAAGEKGRWLRAYARATFAGEEKAVATSAGLLDPLRENFKRWQQLAESDGLDPALATMIRLAVEGLWFADLFGFASPTGTLRARVLDRILELIEESDGN